MITTLAEPAVTTGHSSSWALVGAPREEVNLRRRNQERRTSVGSCFSGSNRECVVRDLRNEFRASTRSRAETVRGTCTTFGTTYLWLQEMCRRKQASLTKSVSDETVTDMRMKYCEPSLQTLVRAAHGLFLTIISDAHQCSKDPLQCGVGAIVWFSWTLGVGRVLIA